MTGVQTCALPISIASHDTGVKVEDLMQSIPINIAGMESSGVSEPLFVAIATRINQSLGQGRGMTSGYAIRSFLQKLSEIQSGNLKSKSFEGALNKLGWTKEQAKKLAFDNADVFVKTMIARIHNLKPQEQKSIWMNIFGKHYESKLSTAFSDLEVLNKLEKELNNQYRVSNEQLKAYNESMQNFNTQSQIAQNLLNLTTIAFGTNFLPAITDTMQNGINPFIESLTQFINENPTLIKNISSIVVTLTSLKSGAFLARLGFQALFGTEIVFMVSKFIETMKELNEVRKKGTYLEFLSSVARNPKTWLVLGALGGIGYYKYGDQIKDFLTPDNGKINKSKIDYKKTLNNLQTELTSNLTKDAESEKKSFLKNITEKNIFDNTIKQQLDININNNGKMTQLKVPIGEPYQEELDIENEVNY